jgi:hypothetical protein
VGKVSDLLKAPLSFLFSTTSAEERVAAYITREHDRGRSLDDILDDPFVVNRVSKEQVGRILERPEVIHAIGQDIAEARVGHGDTSG